MHKKALKMVKKQGWSSRKYRTAWYLTWLMAAMLILPPIAGLVVAFLLKDPAYANFQILPPETFLTMIGAIWFAYFGINLAEKSKLFQKGKSEQQFKEKVEFLNSGGQDKDFKER